MQDQLQRLAMDALALEGASRQAVNGDEDQE
jgi:hypothetical protein